MSWQQEIDLREHGVQLPTHGSWVPIPGSPFEIMTRGTDEFGVFHVRIRGDCVAHKSWEEWGKPEPVVIVDAV